jgi:flagellar biosynthesis/type III secretory pathway protein FliH
MLSSSKVIKTNHSDEVVPYSGMHLPEFQRAAATTGMVEFSHSDLPEFTPNTVISSQPAGVTKTGEFEGMTFTHNNHPGILRNGQGHASVNGWAAPLLHKANPLRVKNSTSENFDDVTRIIDQAKEQSLEIIAAANEKASQIQADAHKEIEMLKQKAFMEGMSAAKAETAQSMHQVERIFQETQLWQEQVMRQSQVRLMEMVIEIGRKLFGSGFELPAEQIDHIVSRAINEGSRLGDLRIYLNPDDSKILVNLWQESEITVNGQRIQIVSSQNISRGGCFVDGQFGIVDGRIEEQMDQIVGTLKPVMTNLQLDEV